MPSVMLAPRRLLGAAAALVVALLAIRALASDPANFGIVLLNGLTAASLYFLVAAGFTLIFGVLRVTNLAHGSLYLLGAYVGYSLIQRTGNWLVGLVGAGLAIAVLGVLIQQVVLRRVQGDPLREALVTIGLSIVAADLSLAFWGSQALDLGIPEALDRSVELPGGIVFSAYRLSFLALAVVTGVGLWALLRHTRLGVTIRAIVDDSPMASVLGVNANVVFAVVFALGAFLAGAAGVAGASYLSISPGEDSRYLLLSLLVVIIGGLGSVLGAAIGAVAIGVIEAFAQVYLPTYSVLITFGAMVAVLAFRPQGILGKTS